MNNVVMNKQKEFKHKMIKLIFAVALSILVLCIIFGIIDYFRIKNGYKPLFIYSKNVESALDIGVAGFEDVVLSNKDGATYYGVGYTISICDTDMKKYTFKLGHIKTKPCNTSLSCNSSKKGSLVLNEDSTVSYNKSDYDSYYYSFYEGKLDKVIATLIRLLSSIENLDTYSSEIKKFYENIPGCYGRGKKLNDESYEIVVACSISEMTNEDINEYLPIRTKELLGYTRDEIIAYHHNDLICE